MLAQYQPDRPVATLWVFKKTGSLVPIIFKNRQALDISDFSCASRPETNSRERDQNISRIEPWRAIREKGGRVLSASAHVLSEYHSVLAAHEAAMVEVGMEKFAGPM